MERRHLSGAFGGARGGPGGIHSRSHTLPGYLFVTPTLDPDVETEIAELAEAEAPGTVFRDTVGPGMQGVQDKMEPDGTLHSTS